MPSVSSSDYAYGLDQASFLSLISTEYPALKGTIYLDHAASPPTPPAAVQSFANALSNTLYANPHSHSPSSSSTTLEIDRVRGRILQVLFGVKNPQNRKWDVIFTAGATAALKLVGEAFPWNGPSSRYRYFKDSHTSLVGIRGCALAKGALVESLELKDIEFGSGEENIETLWAYPAQCNVTGSRLGLGLARELKRRSNAAVLVDAAGYLSSSVLDLDSIPYEEAPDFVACSFYKIYVRPHVDKLLALT
jgi:molybdenum cofactor sulfurtransferase